MAQNRYDALLEELRDDPRTLDLVRPPREPNPYKPLVEEHRQQREREVGDNLARAKETTPARRAEAIRLSKEFRQPVNSIERNFEFFQQKSARAQGNRYDQMLRESPQLVEWLRDPDHAAVAQDDLGNLGALDWIAQAVPRARRQGANMLVLGRLRMKESLGIPLTQFEKDRINAAAFHMELGGDLSADEHWFGPYLTGPARIAPTFAAGAQGALIGGAVGFGIGAAAGGATAAMVSGGVAAPAGAIVGGTHLARIGAGIGMFKVGFELEGGLLRHDLLAARDENGLPYDEDVIRAASIFGGAVNGMAESFQFGVAAKALGLGKLTSRFTRDAITRALKQPSVRRRLADIMADYGKTITEEVGTEIAQRAVSVFAEELVKLDAEVRGGREVSFRSGSDYIRELADEAVGGFQAFALLPLPGATFQASVAVRQTRKAQQTKAWFAALGEAAATTETIKTMPEAVQALMRTAPPGGVTHVFAPTDTWTTYWQTKGVDPAEMADRLTGTKGALETAEQGATDLQIPLDRYTTMLAGTEHNRFFGPELKLDPTDMNERQAADYAEELERQRVEEAERVATTPREPTPLELATQRIVERATAAGATLSEAQGWSELFAAGLGAMTGDANADADAFEQQNPLSIFIQGRTPEVVEPEAVPPGGTGESGTVPRGTSGERVDTLPAAPDVPGPGGTATAAAAPNTAENVSLEQRSAVGQPTTPPVDPAVSAVDEATAEALTPEDAAAQAQAVGPRADPGALATGLNRLLRALGFEGRRAEGRSPTGVERRRVASPSAQDTGSPLDADITRLFQSPRIGVRPFQTTQLFQTASPLEWFGDGAERHAKFSVGDQTYTVDFLDDQESETQRKARGISGEGRVVQVDFALRDRTLGLPVFGNTGTGHEVAVFRAVSRAVTAYLSGEPPGTIAALVFQTGVAPGKTGSRAAIYRRMLRRAGVTFEETSSPVSSRFIIANPQSSEVATLFQAAAGGDGPTDGRADGEGHMGSIEFPHQRPPSGVRPFQISLLVGADRSTFIHELGHYFLEVFGDLHDTHAAVAYDQLTVGQRRLRDNYQALLKEFGLTHRSQITEEHHERFSLMFEKYSERGIAPSVALRPVLARFRAWLLKSYRSLRLLNVELSPEVITIFDRMLASDQAIEEAEQTGRVKPLFLQRPEGMPEAAWTVYREKVEAATRDARADLDRKLVSDVEQERARLRAEQRDEIEGEVTQELQAQPVYRARAAILTGKNPDGTALIEGEAAVRMTLSTDELLREFDEARVAALPRGIATPKGAARAGLVAELFGFTSTDEMLTALTEAPALNDAVKAETDARLEARTPDLVSDGQLPTLAAEALAGEHRDAVIRLELKELSRLQRTVRPFVREAEREARDEARAAKRERDYERRFLEAEAKLRIAIAAGRQQAVIDRLERELSLLKRQARGGAALIRAAVPSAETVTAHARRVVAGLVWRNLQPQLYWSASRRAAKAAIDHAARQEFDAAITAKEQELLNVAIFREATRVKADIERRVARARKLTTKAEQARLGLARGSFLPQILGLLDRYSFKRVTQKALAERGALRAWMEQMQADGLPLDPDEFTPAVMDDLRRVNWQEVTIDELDGVLDGIAQILHQAAKARGQFLAEGQRIYEEKRDELEASIREKNPATRGRQIEFRSKDERRLTIASVFAAHAKLSTLVKMLDGGLDGGPMWTHVMRLINKAGDEEVHRKRVEGERYNAILERHYPGADLARMNHRVRIEAIGDSLSLEGRLAVALNWGNRTSQDRILNDPVRQWDRAQVQAILETLDDNDLAFVNEVWEFVDSFWPEIADKHERVVGVKPEKVEAQSFTVRGITMRGGYYPLKYDHRLNLGFARLEDIGTAKLTLAAAYGAATTKRGHEKTRLEHVKKSVKLELGVAFEHLEQVIHDLTHHEMLLDVTKLIRDKKIATAIRDTRGDAVLKQFETGLRDIAIGRVGADNIMDRAADFVRRGTQFALLGFNFWTAAQQPLGLSNGIQAIGARWVTRGMSRWMRDAARYEHTVTWIYAHSKFMENRGITATQDLNDVRNRLRRPGSWFDLAIRKVTGDTLTQQAILNSYLWHIGAAQMLADVPVWLGQYEKAMATAKDGGLGETEERAFALADQAVLESQGGGQIKDQAFVQRQAPVWRLFLMFYNYGSTVYQQTALSIDKTDFKSPIQVGDFLKDMSLIYFWPAVGTVLLAKLTGRDEEEETGWGSLFEKIGREAMSSAFNTMVLLRELGQLARAGGSRGYSGPAGTRVIQSAIAFGRQVQQGELDAALVRSGIAFGSTLFRLPGAQIQNTVNGWDALREGRTRNPFALLTGGPR